MAAATLGPRVLGLVEKYQKAIEEALKSYCCYNEYTSNYTDKLKHKFMKALNIVLKVQHYVPQRKNSDSSDDGLIDVSSHVENL